MKKKSFILLIVSIFLGVIIGLQARTISKNLSIKTDEGVLRSKELAIELKKTIDERDRQRQEIENLNNLILEYKSEYKGTDDETRILYSEIERYKKLSGLTDLVGQGVIITINDPKGEGTGLSTITDNPEIILRLISVLNSAGAEAISVNGQRITSFTEIERAQRLLEINGVSVSAPIIIKAIGDKDTIIPALNIKTGVVDSLRNYKFEVLISEDDEVTVEKAKLSSEFRFAESVEDEGK